MFEKQYAKKEDIPEGYGHLYVETDGQWVLKNATQVKSEGDVTNVKTALTREREDHKKTKDTLAKFGTLDPETTQEQIDSIPALQAAADANGDVKTQVSDQVKLQLDAKTAPLERKITELTTTNTELTNEVSTLNTANDSRFIQDHLREAGSQAGLHSGGMSDALMREGLFHIVDDGQGNRTVVTKDTNLNPEVWLSEQKQTNSHWWPPSKGAGSRGNDNGGSGGNNPFSHEHWNTTEQMVLYNKDGGVRAKAMAESAGTTIGGPKPDAPKT